MLGVQERCLNFDHPMSDQSLLNEVRAKAQAWTQPPHDEATRQTVQDWLNTCDTDERAREALIDAFTLICPLEQAASGAKWAQEPIGSTPPPLPTQRKGWPITSKGAWRFEGRTTAQGCHCMRQPTQKPRVCQHHSRGALCEWV